MNILSSSEVISIFKQKLLKNKFTYLFLLFFIPLLLAGCSNDNKKEKFDFEEKLKYFNNQNGIIHPIQIEYENNAAIPLPDCFTKDNSYISITNENNFVCSENKVHFSVDVIPKAGVEYYAEYFNDLEIKEQEEINIMLDYCVEARDIGLIRKSRSIYSSLKTYENNTMLLGSVKGKTNNESKELFYQFGVVERKQSIYILQAIMSTENVAFLHSEVLELFKNFSIN